MRFARGARKLPRKENQLYSLLFLLFPLLFFSIVCYEYVYLYRNHVPVSSVEALQRLRKASESDIFMNRRTMIIIANYRDTERCVETLISLFGNASHPHLLRLTIFDQVYLDQNEQTCVHAYCDRVGIDDCHISQIVWQQIDAKDAKGPTFARYHAERAITDEEFCLSVDSHLIFVHNWDRLLLEQWNLIQNENGILTVYPKPVELMGNKTAEDMAQLMCLSHIESDVQDAVISNNGARLLKKNGTMPRLMSQIACGFNFGKCHHIKTVRSDPFTPFLFHGEEYSRAARLWTHGYDLYAPGIDIAFHHFEKRHFVWERDWNRRYFIQLASNRRIRHALGLQTSKQDFDMTLISDFSLGNKRTMEQWINFSRIDPLAPFTGSRKQFDNCRALELVSY